MSSEGERLECAERALWECFLIAGADPSAYCHETRTSAGREAGFQDWRKRSPDYGEVSAAVQQLSDDSMELG